MYGCYAAVALADARALQALRSGLSASSLMCDRHWTQGAYMCEVRGWAHRHTEGAWVCGVTACISPGASVALLDTPTAGGVLS